MNEHRPVIVKTQTGSLVNLSRVRTIKKGRVLDRDSEFYGNSVIKFYFDVSSEWSDPYEQYLDDDNVLFNAIEAHLIEPSLSRRINMAQSEKNPARMILEELEMVKERRAGISELEDVKNFIDAAQTALVRRPVPDDVDLSKLPMADADAE